MKTVFLEYLPRKGKLINWKESILNSKLNNIFDLSNIDWKNIDNYCKAVKSYNFQN